MTDPLSLQVRGFLDRQGRTVDTSALDRTRIYEDAAEADQQSDGSRGTTVASNLAAHMWRNGMFVEDKFPSYRVCPEKQLFFRDPENNKFPLFASDVDRYYLCSPHLYRCVASQPDCIVDLMGVQEVFQELSQIKSVLAMDLFEDKFTEICEAFEKFFIRRANHPEYLWVKKEEDLRIRLISFLHHIVTTVAGKGYVLSVGIEEITGAGGVLGKLSNPPEQRPSPETGVVFPPTLEVNAGVLSSLDLLIPYGHAAYAGKTFAVAELKRICSSQLGFIKDQEGKTIKKEDSPSEPPPLVSPYWYRNGEAMFAQLNLGLFGEGARLGMAILPEGWKAVLLRDVPDTDIAAATLQIDGAHSKSRKCRLGWFSRSLELINYARGNNKGLFCLLMMHIVRIGLARCSKQEPEQALSPSSLSEPAPSTTAFQPSNTENSPTRVGTKRSEPQTAVKSDRDMLDVKKPRVLADKVIQLVGTDGRVVTEMVQLDLKSRFSQVELDDMRREERERNAERWISLEKDDDMESVSWL